MPRAEFDRTAKLDGQCSRIAADQSIATPTPTPTVSRSIAQTKRRDDDRYNKTAGDDFFVVSANTVRLCHHPWMSCEGVYRSTWRSAAMDTA
jgi:hypothetical protein